MAIGYKGFGVSRTSKKKLSDFENDVPFVKADEIEEPLTKEELWQGELQARSYPNTRNDGQIPNNKVLSTDANGYIKMYSVAVAPAPYLEELIPDSYLPETTGNFILKGSFFTPKMCLPENLNNENGILIEEQLINYATFISDNEIHCNVTSGVNEGSFGIILNNGIKTFFSDALLIVLGDVYTPETSEWAITEPINVLDDKIEVQQFGSLGSAVWNRQLDFTKDFRVKIRIEKSPLGNPIGNNGITNLFEIRSVEDDALKFRFKIIYESISYVKLVVESENEPSNNTYLKYTDTVDKLIEFWENAINNEIVFEYLDGIMYAYYNGILRKTWETDIITSNMYINTNVNYSNIAEIKYIELAT